MQAGSVTEMDADARLSDAATSKEAANLPTGSFDPNASVYSSEAANETMSDAIGGERNASQWSLPINLQSQRIDPCAMDVEESHYITPIEDIEDALRERFAQVEFVTQAQLSTLLRQLGARMQDTTTTGTLKELQTRGVLGSYARGKGTE